MNNEMGTELGKNLTGTMMSPLNSVRTAEGAVELTNPVPEGSSNDFALNRIRYMKEADPVGTMPLPASIKGAISSAQEKIMNGNHGFMDKLGERIAFERSGTRLYECLLSKYLGSDDKNSYPPIEILQQFHAEEKSHFQLTAETMKSLGGDPTAMTPSADICGVAALGWVQIMSDPRTNFKQCLEIILQAELVDNACWEVLIEMARETGLEPIAQKFEQALAEENNHLATIKEWVREFNVNGKVTKGTKH